MISDLQWIQLSERQLCDWFYGVTTTKIYCRTDCSSRRPKRENVEIFEARDKAEAAGFRACKRCFDGVLLAPEVSRIIEEAGKPVKLTELSRLTGYSKAHLRRRFQNETGLTPQEYGAEVRRRRFRGELAAGESVTSASLEAGYGSSAHASGDADCALGMTPSDFRQSGEKLRIEWAAARSELGWVLAARTSRGVCSVEIDESLPRLRESLGKHFPKADLVESKMDGLLQQIVKGVEKPQTLTELPLDLRGTVFQQRVWTALRELPPGTTTTYGELAKKLGKPKAYRAVARACATNRVAVAVPCHRVVGKNGKLTGYRWGLDVKRELLEREAQPAAE